MVFTRLLIFEDNYNTFFWVEVLLAHISPHSVDLPSREEEGKKRERWKERERESRLEIQVHLD